MQIDLRTVSIEPLRQTFDHVSARIGADKTASRYMEATMDIQPEANHNYRPTWDPEHEIFDASRTAITMTAVSYTPLDVYTTQLVCAAV